MCGIVGMYLRYPSQDRELLLAMRDTMLHRGPDDAGAWWSDDGKIGLAHRRLAIIDISASGHQPMRDSTGRYIVVYNGELYNYRELREELLDEGHTFRSASDTEVLLESYKRWGPECLGRLLGAFAFAICDTVTGTLFLARDRVGEKPLFYRYSQDGFAFASELKALMADPFLKRSLDLEALDHYLAYGYVAGGSCIIRGTCKLLPGHAMIYSGEKNDCRIWRYWSLPEPAAGPFSSTEQLADELESLLSDAVKRQLVADVPVGVLLSGGLDSSLITALAARAAGRRIKTFTVSFPGHGSLDEGPFAKIVADHFGTEHTELVTEPASVNLLPNLARQYDEPIADHSIVPTSMLAGLVRGSVTVALGGDGGDELFGGYPHYNFLQKTVKLRECLPAAVRGVASHFAAHLIPVGTKGRNHIIGLRNGAACSISAVNIYLDEFTRRKLLTPLYHAGFRPQITPEEARQRFYDPKLSMFQNASRNDFENTLADDYLVKSDRASMLYSLELRAPFLDHKLIEFAYGRLPDHLRASTTERKVLLRILAKRLLPPSLDITRKQGFTLPIGAWFRGAWGDFMIQVLMEADQSIFDRRVITGLIDGQKKGRNNGDRLFAITMFELWRREYKISI